MGIISCILSLCGCTKKPVKPQSELTSISIYQNHMDSMYCYSFGAYKKNDTYTLEASCMLEKGDNDYESVELENVSITEEEFAQFEKLDKKYDFFSLRKPNKKEKNRYVILDETIRNFSVRYGDEGIAVETNGECFEAVNELFFQLAEKYADNNK